MSKIIISSDLLYLHSEGAFMVLDPSSLDQQSSVNVQRGQTRG